MPTARLSTWVVQQAVPSFLTEDDDMAHWGNVTYSTAALGANPSCGSSDLEDVRSAFLAEQPLPVGLDDGNGRVGVETVYASAHDFGMVGDSNNTDGDSTSEAMVCYTTGSTQTPTARYLHTGSVAQLAAWWQACYGADLMGLVRCHWHDFAEAGRLAAEVTATLEGDIPRFYEAAGEVEEEPLAELGLPDIPEADALYVITALSARQVMASPPHMFQKELSSDGNVNAVDVVYPAAPFFLWANPEMLRFLLQPAVDMQEADATGHVDGDDKAMPVEEAANMVLLAYAYRRFSGNAAWLVRRVAQLRRFAQHRAAAALVPAVQLSTNDFAGALANQTNLAIKGILALGAMAEVEGVTLRGPPLPPTAWYPLVAQRFGVPLDSRHHYTKSDWLMWAAAAASGCRPSTRRPLVTSLAAWLNNTATDVPFADLFEMLGDGSYPQVLQDIRSRARPVVGSHFAILALARSQELGRPGNGTVAIVDKAG